MTDKPIAGPKDGHPVKAYGILQKGKALEPVLINRRKPDDHDVCIDIKYCGICHSDLHGVKNEWGNTVYPLVPGHEIVGVVTDTGSKVSKFKKGDTVGVSPIIDSCRQCAKCKNNKQQYCDKEMVQAYNTPYAKDGGALTCGGFSGSILVDENYLIKIPSGKNLAEQAPLLCAGITVFSPLKFLKTNEHSRVAIVGFGGLGHLALKIAKAMKADVSIISRSANKKKAALKLGAKNFIVSTDKEQMKQFERKFDIILDTACGKHDLNELITLLDVDGTLVILGAPPEAFQVYAFPLIMKHRRLMGSCIGSPSEAQEMINFCHDHAIVSDIEIIPVEKINAAMDTLSKGDVAHRFVIDMNSLKSAK